MLFEEWDYPSLSLRAMQASALPNLFSPLWFGDFEKDRLSFSERKEYITSFLPAVILDEPTQEVIASGSLICFIMATRG